MDAQLDVLFEFFADGLGLKLGLADKTQRFLLDERFDSFVEVFF